MNNFIFDSVNKNANERAQEITAIKLDANKMKNKLQKSAKHTANAVGGAISLMNYNAIYEQFIAFSD